jgi:hypothetical protein
LAHKLEWGLGFVSPTVVGKDKPKGFLRLINIPRQRNLRRPESSSHCRFVGIEMLDNGIIAFDLQNIKDFLAGVCFANAGIIHLKPA